MNTLSGRAGGARTVTHCESLMDTKLEHSAAALYPSLWVQSDFIVAALCVSFFDRDLEIFLS